MLIGKLLHVLATVVWVGGMFFAYNVLRPSAGALPPPERLKLWRRVFARFFPWVWASVVLLPLSGLWMIEVALGGFAAQPLFVELMIDIGGAMIVIFLVLYFGPWRRFARAVDGGDFAAAGVLLPRIRWIVGLNLVLGLVTVAIAATGRYW